MPESIANRSQPSVVQIKAEDLMKARNEVLASPNKEVGFANIGPRISDTMVSVNTLLHLVEGNTTSTSFQENAATVRATNEEVARHNILLRKKPIANAVHNALHPVEKFGIAHSHPLSVPEAERHDFSSGDINTIKMRTGSEIVHILFSMNKDGGVQVQAVNGLGRPINIEVVMPDGKKVLIGPGQPKGKLGKALAPYMTPPAADGKFSIGDNRIYNPNNPKQYPTAA